MVGNFASGYYASSTEIIYDSYEIGSKLGIYDKSRKSSVHYSEPRDWGGNKPDPDHACSNPCPTGEKRPERPTV